MQNYIVKLKQYIAANPSLFDGDCDNPALEVLYWHYGQCHTMCNEKTKAANRALYDCLDALSFREQDQVSCLVGALCAEHEHIAFLAGLQLGAQLMQELTKDPA